MCKDKSFPSIRKIFETLSCYYRNLFLSLQQKKLPLSHLGSSNIEDDETTKFLEHFDAHSDDDAAGGVVW
jgi:hypothetical protein